MVKIDTLFEEKKINIISDLEIERYINFFENTYKENLEHCKANLVSFPRWSIISGYVRNHRFLIIQKIQFYEDFFDYAMHDTTKLFFAKKFNIKIDFEVHKTTIRILREVIKDKETLKLLKAGYKEFVEMANDLFKAKKERTGAQYYTITEFMKEKYREKAGKFLNNTVIPYLNKMQGILKPQNSLQNKNSNDDQKSEEF